jgi:hypothetical protein
MKPLILISAAFVLLTIIGYRKKEVPYRPKNKDCFTCASLPEGTIFCDDFESDAPLQARYFEYDDNDGDFLRLPNAGRDGSAGMRALWQKGEVSAGALKKSFGRTPGAYIGTHAAFPEKDFKEIYWRIDVKREAGWVGGGADKLTRATVFADAGWKQGTMAHLWSSGDFLVLDPASGIDDHGTLKSTKYNDFANLRWLGSKKGTTALFNDTNGGKWLFLFYNVKLNHAGTFRRYL